MKIPNLDRILNGGEDLSAAGIFRLIGEAFVGVGQQFDNVMQKLSVNPNGTTDAPHSPNAISVTATASGIHHVVITDSNARTRNVNYFVEHSTDPNFVQNVQTEHLGVARQRRIAQSMGTTPVYYRAYAQYPDGSTSDMKYFGSATAPTPVVDNATVLGPPHPPTAGSGTSAAAGYGFGRESFIAPRNTPGLPPKVFGAVARPKQVSAASTALPPPPPPPPPGGTDMLTVVRLDPSLQGNTFLDGPQGPIYTFVDPSSHLTWYIKGAAGFPWDAKPYDATNFALNDWITENDRTDPHTFKNWETPIPLVPRFYTAGSGQWSHLTTGTPLFDVHTSCSVFTTHNLGPQVLGTFEGTFVRNFGGDIGTRPYYLCTYNYNWNGLTYVNSEHLFFVGPLGDLPALGWVRWELWTNGSLVQFSDFNLIKSGTVTLDFPCSLPFLP